jgi:ABC-type Mn2+/Zn2+ transport system permease subunit
MLLMGALPVWFVETETRISAEAIIGVLFSTALAVGSMITSGEELIDALFGKPGLLSCRRSCLALLRQVR